MNMSIFRRIANLFHRSKLDQDIDAELRAHIEMRTADNIATGMSSEEARRQAVLRFGSRPAMKERAIEADAHMFLDSLWQDVRYALRMLRKSPGFTAVAVLTLALGIGANTAIFSVIDGVLLSSLPYAHPSQLVAAKDNDSLQDIIDIQRESHVFSQGGGINFLLMDSRGPVEPVKIRVGMVNAGFLETLGVPPMLGRIIAPDEDVKGGPRVAVVSYSFWQNSLGSDPRAIGRTILLDENSYTVIGVMPRQFALPIHHADVFISLWAGDPGAAQERDVHFLHTYWRLKPGVSLAQAEADMAVIDHRLAEQYPSDEKHRKTEIVPLHEWLVQDLQTDLLVLFGAVGFVLLIACTNFAGLLMARADTRRQELVIRGALGAGRRRLIRQALTESTLLSVIGGAAGLLLAKWGTTALLSFMPAELERFRGIQMDARILVFVLGLSFLTGIISGFVPAWSATHARVAEALKETGRSSTTGRRGHGIRQILVICELALCMILLIGAGLLIKAFSQLRAVNPGFNPANVTTMTIQLPEPRYTKIPRQTEFRRQLLQRLNSLPGVQAAMISDIPFGGNYVGHSIVIDGRPPVAQGDAPKVQTLSVMGDYFPVMQTSIRAGRGFTDMDRENQPLVAIINEALARELFSDQNPIGARIDWANEIGPHQWMTIVGVVADVKHEALDQPADPAIYTPFAQSDEKWRRLMTVAMRTQNSSAGLVEQAKKIVWSLDGDLAISDVQTMDELLSVSLAQQRFDMLLLGLFAALALILALIGTYGVMAYVVSRRTHEIGVRIALGAQTKDVLALVIGEAARLALTGIAIGLVGAFALTRLMSSLLFEVKPTDPATFAGVAVLFATLALLACYVPARRAMRVDPMVALRYE
ncbi:MAG TPA: ABC transporter permease [Candidatus Acidoferrales bacterium]|nr:ABC transporter permease [Candidatus Acidoferrales bacterium]